MRKKGFTTQLDAETGRGYGRQQQMIVSYTMEGDKGLRMRNVEPAPIL